MYSDKKKNIENIAAPTATAMPLADDNVRFLKMPSGTIGLCADPLDEEEDREQRDRDRQRR